MVSSSHDLAPSQGPNGATRGPALRRFLEPNTVAVIGASEEQPRSNNAVKGLLGVNDLEVMLVNPNRPVAYGRETYPSLRAIDRPVDAVLSLVNAEATIDVVHDAARTGAGGVVVVAGGFGEAGDQGQERQRRLCTAAGSMPLCGPNCAGFVNARVGVSLSPSLIVPTRSGGIGLVSQTGVMASVFAYAGRERDLGFSSLITCGNEAALGIADYLDYLIDDTSTVVICLVLETLRDPDGFLDAAARARDVGKPVLALKLGRTERARDIARSHSGALAGEPWAYDAVLRQFGVQVAADVPEMLDRATCFEHVPRQRWSQARGVAVLSGSGGGAQLAADVLTTEGVDIPSCSELQPAIANLVPGAKTVNPLDFTGFAVGRPEMVTRLTELYAGATQVDVLSMQVVTHAEEFETFGGPLTDAFLAGTKSAKSPVILGSVDEAAILGPQARARRAQGIAVTRGMTAMARAIESMARFQRDRQRRATAEPPAPAQPIAAWTGTTVGTDAGPALAFADAMGLIASVGIPIAEFAVIAEHDPVAAPDFPGPYVAKLADVAHRTELDGVRLELTAAQLPGAVSVLREQARIAGVSPSVAIQTMVRGDGEAFVGVDVTHPLGPLVLLGLGGVLLETLGRGVARRAPLDSIDVEDLLAPMAALGIFDGLRGSSSWNRTDLEQILSSAGRLAVGAGAWLASVDINPLVHGPNGLVAVDALVITR